MEQNTIQHLGKSDTGKNGIRVTSDFVFSYPPHTHAYYEMTLYEPFDGSISVNGKTLRISEPTAILITPTDFHRIDVEGEGGKFIKVAFDESIIGERCFAARLPIRCAAENPGLLKGLFCELLTDDDALYSASLICTIVSYLEKHGEVLPGMGGRNGSKKELLSAAVGIMNREFCEDMTLALVARRLNISPQYLSKAFSEAAGVTFSEYLCGLRLRRSAQLIREGGMSVTETCFACGYRNLSHFLRSFKRMYGVTPGEYKNSFLS